MPETLDIASHEQDGRVLSGAGVTSEALKAVMDRRTPKEAQRPVAPLEPSPSEPPAAEPQAVAPVEPKPPRGQKRFDQLTHQREEAERAARAEKERADTTAQELAALRAELDAIKSQRATPEPKPAATPSAQPAAATTPVPATRPKPTEDEIGTKYPSYADFAEDLADWKVEQRLATIDLDARIRQSLEADRASRTLQQQVADAQTRGKQAYADFEALVMKGGGPGSSVDIPMDRLQFVLQHPASEHLQYAIAKDAALAQRVASCHPLEFGAVLASIAPAAAVASPASTAPAASAVAPPPYQPVGAGSRTTVTPSADLIQKAGFDFDKSGYRERRAAERGVTRRR